MELINVVQLRSHFTLLCLSSQIKLCQHTDKYTISHTIILIVGLKISRIPIPKQVNKCVIHNIYTYDDSRYDNVYECDVGNKLIFNIMRVIVDTFGMPLLRLYVMCTV